MADYKDLEFLAEKVKELLDRQIDSYRANHTKAGTIIGISSVFIPIFLFLIENPSTLNSNTFIHPNYWFFIFYNINDKCFKVKAIRPRF